MEKVKTITIPKEEATYHEGITWPERPIIIDLDSGIKVWVIFEGKEIKLDDYISILVERALIKKERKVKNVHRFREKFYRGYNRFKGGG